MTKDSSGPRLVYCTCPDSDVAEQLARQLVERKLAACVNIISGVRSVYEWQGELCNDAEALLLIKTTADKLEPLQGFILSEHPYELPEVIAVPIEAGLPAYLDWIDNTLN